MSFLRKGVELRVSLKSNLCFLLIHSTGVSTALYSHRVSTVLQCCSMYGTKEKFHVLKGRKKILAMVVGLMTT